MNTKNSITTIGFDFPTEGNVVYESPDGGKTIYLRDISDNTKMEKIKEKAPLIANIMKDVNKNEESNDIVPSTDEFFDEVSMELNMLRTKVLNLEIENSDLKDMLREKGVDIV